MLIVSDTSPIINLAAINHLYLLPELFEQIIIPQMVYQEIVIDGAGEPGSDEIQTAHWVEIQRCTNQDIINILSSELDPGKAEAIALANSSAYGLGASVWSKRNGEKIASKLQCGMVSINSTFIFAAMPSVPFGGVKASGYGRAHGPEGLLEFTYARTVVRTRFKLPLDLTSFRRTKFTEQIIVGLTKLLHGKRTIK